MTTGAIHREKLYSTRYIIYYKYAGKMIMTREIPHIYMKSVVILVLTTSDIEDYFNLGKQDDELRRYS